MDIKNGFYSCFRVLRIDALQIRAVILKDLTLISRKWKNNLCQIITPVVCLLFLFILQIIVDDVVIPEFKKTLPFTKEDIPAIPLNLPMVQVASLVQNQLHLKLPLGIEIHAPTDLLFQYDKDNPTLKSQTNMIPNLFNSNLTFVETEKETSEILYEGLQHYADNTSYEYSYIGALKIRDIDESGVEFVGQYQFQGVGSLFSTGGRYDGMTNLCQILSLTKLGSCESIISAYIIDLVQASYLWNITNGSAFSLSFVAQMPFEFVVPVQIDVVSMLAAFIFPLLLIVPLPSILYSLVLEKEFNIKEMMSLMGLKERNYICPTFCIKLLQVLLTYLAMFFLGLILQIRMFTLTNFFILLYVAIFSSLVVVSLAFLISSIIRNTFIGTIVAYLMVVFFPIIGFFLDQFVFSKGPIGPKFLFLISPLTITETVTYMSDGCNDFQCFSWNAFKNVDFLVSSLMGFFDFFLYMFLYFYLDQVMPKPWGVRKHPLFFLKWIFCPFFKICDFRKNKKAKLIRIEDEDDENSDSDERFKKFSSASDSLIQDLDSTELYDFEDEDVSKMRKRIEEDLLEEEEKGIIVKGLTKAFSGGCCSKNHYAVNNVFFSVGKQECFGLLGSNGAGKSTIMRMLSGIYSPTSGTAEIDGMELSENLSSIRRALGYCPQFTVKWDDLTASEHILFYTRLKGVSICNEKAEVEKLLRKVELLPKKPKWRKGFCNFIVDLFNFMVRRNEKKAGELSGGMMRRLAIAISLSGNPRLVLLDEPTTGLDPFHKRGIWNVIMKEKQDRSIILSSHSMEESEVLCDRISIMKDGKILCCGPSLHLKDKFGSGYKVTCKLTNSKNIEDFKDSVFVVISEYCDIQLVSDYDSSVHRILVFLVKKKLELEIPIWKIFEILESIKSSDKFGLTDFDVNQASLEDVFLKVVGEGFQDMEFVPSTMGSINIDDKDNIEVSDFEEEEEKSILDEEAKEDDYETINDMIINEDEEVLRDDEKEKSQEPLIIISEEKKEKKCCRNWFCGIWIFCRNIFLQILFLLEKNFLISVKNWKSSCIELFSPFLVVALLFILTLLAGLIKNEAHIYNEETRVQTDELVRCTSWGDLECYTLAYTTNGNVFVDRIMEDVIESYGLKSNEVKVFESLRVMEDYLSNNPNRTQTAVAFFNVSTLKNISGKVEVILDQVKGYLNFEPFNSTLDFIKAFSISDLKDLEKIKHVILYTIYYNSTLDVVNQATPLKIILDNYIHYHIRKDLGYNQSLSKETLKVWKQDIPKIRNRKSINGQSIVLGATGALFFSLSTLILFVISLFRLVVEKETELRYSLEMIGMKKVSYLVSWFVTFFLFGFGMSIVSVLSGWIFVLDPFVYSNPIFMFILFLIYQLSLICLSFVFSSCFTRTKSALTFGFIFLSLTFILNIFIGNGAVVYLVMDLKGARKLIPLLFEIFYPPFNFSKMFQDIINKTVKVYDVEQNQFINNVGYTSWKDFVGPNTFLGIDGTASYRSLLMLFLNAFIYLVLFLYLDVILPTPKGNSKSPFFLCFPKFWLRCFGFHLGKETINQNLAKKSQDELENMKEDLRTEYDRVRDQNYDAMIRIANLSKTYNSLFGKRVRALKGIDLSCKRGSVLSFLGHNGAGKSTAINIIAGLMRQSGGEIFVDEYNTQNNITEVLKRLGVCLQHDHLWGELTPNEHMRLFCRLKGIRWGKKLEKEVKRRLKEVALYDVRKKRSSKLSGGMKRRLSLALSFVGKPKLVILDEPSTGLDPHSRRLVWKVVKNAYSRYNISIMLTSHSMDEADALSHQISILQSGKILVVGDPLDLKSSLGEGYVLKFICVSGKEDIFDDFIKQTFPSSKELMANSSSFIYNISKENTEEMIMGIKKVEENMKMRDDNTLIKDFGVSSSTLEDIYLRVTKKDGEKHEDGGGLDAVTTIVK